VHISNHLKNVGAGTVYNHYGESYFSLERLNSLLKIISENDLVKDLVITPYYFFDNKIMELYDYSLSIQVLENVGSRERFLLEETGKTSIEEIDLKVLEKLNNTYFEVKEGDVQSFLKSLEHYLKFMNDNESQILIQIRDELNVQYVKNDGIFYEII
jgi:hypothetical protein